MKSPLFLWSMRRAAPPLGDFAGGSLLPLNCVVLFTSIVYRRQGVRCRLPARSCMATSRLSPGNRRAAAWVWILEHRDGSNHYGFPMPPDNPGLKLASYKRSQPTDIE